MAAAVAAVAAAAIGAPEGNPIHRDTSPIQLRDVRDARANILAVRSEGV